MAQTEQLTSVELRIGLHGVCIVRVRRLSTIECSAGREILKLAA